MKDEYLDKVTNVTRKLNNLLDKIEDQDVIEAVKEYHEELLLLLNYVRSEVILMGNGYYGTISDGD